MCSSVDVDPFEEPQYQCQEQPSSEQFEQQPEQYEEGKYNMNNLSPLITISYCILIPYAYKDFLATLYPLYIPLGCILVSCARLLRYNTIWSFLINLINGLLELNSESGPLCFVLEWLTSRGYLGGFGLVLSSIMIKFE